MAEPIVLVDGDPIVYRVGFAAQQRVIHAVCEGPDGEPYKIRFEGRKDRNKYLAEHPEHVLLEEEDELIVEPLPFALQTVKQIFGVLERLGTPKVFLTGTGNFREKLATVLPYKGNRDKSHRPAHYAAIREYLLTNKGAVMVNGREADDEISIQAHALKKARRRYIVATIDKDLDQIPGKHYNYAEHVEYDVSALEAEKWLWRQVLSGDPTDNIPGCWRVGKERAAEIVDTWYQEYLRPQEHWQRVLQIYADSRRVKGCPYAKRDAKEVALETARLVYMQREIGELWNPPGEPMGRIEESTDADD